MGLNTGIEIRNPSGTTFLTPDNSICRIIDKIWVGFGQQPICMNNNYAFENYLDDDEGLKQAKKTAMKQYIAKYKKTSYTENDYDTIPASERWQVREMMKELFKTRTVAWNQNKRGQLIFHAYLEEHETLFLTTVGHNLRAAATDTVWLPGPPGIKEYKDMSAVNIWFEVPGADGKKYDAVDGLETPGHIQEYIKNPYWGYVIVGAM